MRRMLIIMALLLLVVTGAWAEDLELKVTKTGANLYSVADKDLYIQTEYCFEDANDTLVKLRLEETDSKLIFKDVKQPCEIKMVYGRAKIDAGNYQFKVTRDDDNWYRLVDQDAAFKTAGCLSLVENVDAQLTLNDDGTGTLTMSEVDETCQVEGVYSKAELSVEKK